jgi:hypothetical protein
MELNRDYPGERVKIIVRRKNRELPAHRGSADQKVEG